MQRQKRKWEHCPAPDSGTVADLASSLGIERAVASLLLQRGIDSREAALKFFNPSFEDLHDPFLMKGMAETIDRIERAIYSGERVMIYGDYDVDGTSSTALMINYFSQWLGDMLYYIPDRYAEGYGISQKGIDYAADNGVTLIITVDCGIKAIEEVEYARSRGVDFIITDHHLADEELPAAVAVVDPKQADCPYPFKDLSGCGVAFKIAQGYAQKHGRGVESIGYLLDLVVVSIAADIVPLVDENRAMAHYGLIQLNSKEVNLGLGAIINICQLGRRPITIEDIVFKIGPRINATGRMEIDIDPEDSRAQSGGRSAVRLMTARSKDRAKYYVEIIEKFNHERKNADRAVTLRAKEMIASDPSQHGRSCTIIYCPEWMKGVVGIVASRLIESYYRPTVVLTKSNDMITGSARSIPGFDLYGAVESCSDLLENFGGHTYAVGLTIRPENLEEFKARFERYVDANIESIPTEQSLEINMRLDLEDITPKLRRELNVLAPFGAGNPAPIFASYGVRDSGGVRAVGVGAEHLKLALCSGIGSIEAIAFSFSSYLPHIASGGAVDICYSITENHYGSRVSAQLKIKDIVVDSGNSIGF